MAVAWSEQGLTRVRFPEATVGDLIEKLAIDLGDVPLSPPPTWVKEAIQKLQAYLKGTTLPSSQSKAHGGLEDLSTIPLDFTGISPFHLAVYKVSRTLAPAEIVTYGELAEMAGSPRAARAVGSAMANNRFSVIVPCHRIVASGGKPGGFSAYGELVLKDRLLQIEGGALRAKPAARAFEYDVEVGLKHLKQVDPKLAVWMDTLGPFRMALTQSPVPFESLIRSIVYQQLSGKAAGTIYQRLLALFPRKRFPTPRDLVTADPETLRGAGLSRNKVLAVQDLAAKTIDKTVPSLKTAQAMGNAELIERLVQVRGIGRWSVEMFLLFGLGRPDILAGNDLGIQKGLTKVLERKELMKPKQVLAYTERYAPYRSIASWYLWRIADSG